ncbi:hypothetical protein PR048_012744 [Dryococelus australis]|uniref:Uncharacterized protein n=1 Tax=Dryococelus australis TaxID=614101 RepID=A0ABQ9HQ86_9NEOP|nr:hypothetical protein PR048_012744 [Dryococelus australis]
MFTVVKTITIANQLETLWTHHLHPKICLGNCACRHFWTDDQQLYTDSFRHVFQVYVVSFKEHDSFHQCENSLRKFGIYLGHSEFSI